MEIISGIAGLLIIVVWVGTIVGLINPKWLQGKKENSKLMTRKEIGSGCIGATVLLGIIGVVASPSSEINTANDAPAKIVESQATVIPEVSKEPLKEIKVETNLGMTPEEFRLGFNNRLNELDIDAIRPLAEFHIKNGDVRDVFQIPFSNEINMTGIVNKDGMLREITFIIMPNKDSEQTMMEALILIGTASNTVNANSEKEKIGKAVTGLITKALEGVDKENNTHNQVVGGIKYYALASEYTGLWFGMSPAEE